MARVRSRRVGGTDERRLFSVIDFVPTPGTSEATLLSYAMGARQLGADYEGLEIHAAYQTAGNANSKTGRLKIGGTTILTRTAADNGQDVQLYVRLWRFSATTFQGWATVRVGSTVNIFSVVFGSVTWASAQTIALTGQTPTAAGDINAVQLDVRFLP